MKIMEFKGTKEKWQLSGKYITTSLEDVCEVFCWDNEQDQFLGSTIEGSVLSFKANALLISKAPEMLDMLIKLRDNCDGNNFSLFRDKLEDLIKEATDVR